MRKTTYYILLIVIVVVATIITIGLNKKARSTRLSLLNLDAGQSSALPKTYKDILKYGRPVKCTFENKDALREPKGTIFANNNDIRIDLTALNKNNVLKTSHSIVKDGYTYLWFEGDKAGMKTTVKEDLSTTTQSSATGDIEDKLDFRYYDLPLLEDTRYTCDNWEPDNFIFEPPAEIEFIELKTFVEELKKGLCERCDLENTTTSRISCKIALKCNE